MIVMKPKLEASSSTLGLKLAKEEKNRVTKLIQVVLFFGFLRKVMKLTKTYLC